MSESNLETYKLRVFCKNCDFEGEADMPRGRLVEEVSCPKCGTVELEKDNPPVIISRKYESYE